MKCTNLHFDGLTDETINQGADFDALEGVKAYDADGNEIDFSVEPEEFDSCAVGEQTLVYKAMGKDNRLTPSMCIPKDSSGANLPLGCTLTLLKENRKITVLQADPPRFIMNDVTIPKNTTLDVLDGVSAVDDNGNPITDIDYSGYLDKQASGDIVSISDGDNKYPVKSLKVTLEPIQDLHGYDKPWTAGAGKNKFDADTVYADYIQSDGSFLGRAGYINLIKTAIPTEWIGQQLTFSAQLKIPSGSIVTNIRVSATVNGSSISGNAVNASDYTLSSVTFTPTSAEDTVNITFGSESGQNLQFKSVQLEKGSSASAFNPYSNICPISGHTECVTEVCGKNLFDKSSATIGKWLNVNTGAEENTTNAYALSDYIRVVGGVTYNMNQPNSARRWFYDVNKNPVQKIEPLVFTPPQDGYIRITIGLNNTDINTFQIELGSTATDYEAYDGTSYTTTLGRTVYGGTVDVVSGELVVDRAMVDLSSLSWSRYSPSGTNIPVFYAVVSGMLKANEGASLPICSSYKCEPWSDLLRREDGTLQPHPTLAIVYVADSRFEDASAFTSAVSGQTLVYELATPQTYQLDPQTISLLHGNNNVWSDGEIEMVYSVELPTDGEVSYPLEGEYEITYSASDKCGNIGEAIRHITVQ